MRRIPQLAALLAATAAVLAAGASPAAAACPSQNHVYDSTGSALATFPNDPLYPKQWGIPQIQVPGAWGLGGIGSGAVVAVVDTGVDQKHPDLAGQLLPGQDFAQEKCAEGAQDENGHGTHVAGIVAALTNNGLGVAGTAPGAKILPVRVLEADGSASVEQMTNGIRWAADNGADVINLSIGDTLPEALIPWEDWASAVDHAWSKGAVIVAAAGNDPIPLCESPANVPNVVCVAATDSSGFPTFYSSFPNSPNEGVQLRAPGGSGLEGCDGDVWSTLWPGMVDDIGGGSYDTCGPKGYEPLAGTSMAAPHVSGVAAILAAGGLTNTQIMDCLRATSSNGGSFDPVYGYGIVNAQAAAAGCGANFSQAPAPAGSTAPPNGGGSMTPSPQQQGVAGRRSASDTTAPRVRLALGSARRARIARSGRLPVRIRSSEPARVAIRVVSGRLTAAAGRNAVLIARGTVRARAGLTTARLRLTRTGRKMLRQRRSRTVSLMGSARDAAGNTGTAATQARLR